MKRWIALLVVALAMAAPAGVWGPTSAQEAETTVKVAETPELGSFLTDAEGRTLYLWTVDLQAGVSNCYGPCVDFWPLFTADEPLTLPDGVEGTAKVLADTAASPVTEATTLLIAHDPALGDYFTDGEGRTVYLFTKDAAIFSSACTGDCLTNWPPVPAPSGRLTLPPTAFGELAPMNGNDGAKQLAFNGIPLYYFAGDTEPGQINGQGVGGVWWIVAPGAVLGSATPAAS